MHKTGTRAAGTRTNALDDDARPSRYRDDDPPPMNFNYNYDDGSSRLSRNKAAAPSAEVLDRAAGARNAAASSSTVFFLEEAVRVGGTLPFHSMIPPDTTADDAAVASPPLRLYTVRVVRAVDGWKFMVCRRDREARPGPGASDDDERDAVYGCRATGPARAYVVDVVGERGETAAAVVVCRTDTSRWNHRARAAFGLLDVKPGGAAAVCHAALDAQVIPVKNDRMSSASLV